MAFAIVVLLGAYVALSRAGTIDLLENGAALKQWILQLGATGPFVIIGLIAVAIVLSPIPSAPIALAAGAAYGHTAGTLYVATGSELGAMIAFLIARLLGVSVVKKWAGERFSNGMLGSQNTLMGIVFATRLLPFISFDMVSYAAGVTSLTFWRFAIATLAGILPASFLLAHFGSELTSGENQRVGITVLLLGCGSLLIILAKKFRSKRNQTKPND